MVAPPLSHRIVHFYLHVRDKRPLILVVSVDCLADSYEAKLQQVIMRGDGGRYAVRKTISAANGKRCVQFDDAIARPAFLAGRGA